MRTPLADKLVGKRTMDQILHDAFLLGPFDQVLNPVNQNVEKFISILLDPGIDRASVDVLEGKAELFGVVVLLAKLVQSAENAFQLVQYIFRVGLFAIPVPNFQQELSELGNHEKLL
jgi:hypothetical protein